MTSYTLRTTEQDGTVHEVELTPEQAFDLKAGRAIAYTPRDERILADENGQIIQRESAIPQMRGEVA